jgi:SAM-dependent methyltransferase
MFKAGWTRIHELLELVGIHFQVKWKNFLEYIHVILNYYSNPVFLKTDSSLLLSYLFHNPFRISKRFLLSQGESDPYTYGETPLTTLEQIALRCRLSSADTVFELGCGRGRTCFWLHAFVGCSVVGIEYIPDFVKYANQVVDKFKLRHIEFREEDLLKTDLKGATVIYLYGTCFTSAFIERLTQRLDSLPMGTKVITVSYALKDYVLSSPFQVVESFPARFTWGEAEVFLQVKK